MGESADTRPGREYPGPAPVTGEIHASNAKVVSRDVRSRNVNSLSGNLFTCTKTLEIIQEFHVALSAVRHIHSLSFVRLVCTVCENSNQ